MTTAVAFGFLLGLGAFLVVTAQPFGKARPSIAARLEALRPDVASQPSKAISGAFRFRILEDLIRDPMERAGELLLGLARRLGLDLGETTARLKAVGDAGGLVLFLGQKVAACILGLCFLPLAAAVGGAPSTPGWLWLAMAAISFFYPDVALRSRSEVKRREMKEELAHFADLTALAVSAGHGLESALERVASAAEGTFFVQLRKALREARLQGRPASAALETIAEDLRISEAEPLASALAAADLHGAKVSQVLRVQARAIRERRRIEIIEAGERAPTRMALPVGLLILPAFFIVVLYPAAVQLLQLTAR